VQLFTRMKLLIKNMFIEQRVYCLFRAECLCVIWLLRDEKEMEIPMYRACKCIDSSEVSEAATFIRSTNK